MDELQRIADGIRQDGRVDIAKLANTLGVAVFGIDVSNFADAQKSAFLKKEDDGTYAIYVNEDQSSQRQRFSIAHEIGHYWLHREKLEETGILDRSSYRTLNSAHEDEADKFAANLLMPEGDVTVFLDLLSVPARATVPKRIIEQVCSRYDVSFYAGIVRLRELGYYVPFIDTYAV